MPTKHPRHSITETPRLRDKLEPLRRRGARVDFGELVELGAETRLAQLEARETEEQRKARLRRELVEQLRTSEGLDVAAAYEVREHGWTH
jgi:hypothetical protein